MRERHSTILLPIYLYGEKIEGNCKAVVKSFPLDSSDFPTACAYFFFYFLVVMCFGGKGRRWREKEKEKEKERNAGN